MVKEERDTRCKMNLGEQLEKKGSVECRQDQSTPTQRGFSRRSSRGQPITCLDWSPRKHEWGPDVTGFLAHPRRTANQIASSGFVVIAHPPLRSWGGRWSMAVWCLLYVPLLLYECQLAM